MKVVVLAGGISTERDVSLISGSMIYQALKRKGHQAIIVDIYLGYKGETAGIFEADIDWTQSIAAITADKPDLAKIKAMRPDGDKHFFGPNVLELCQEADAVFMALHGVGGEDGKVQAAFDLLGINYTGTDFTSAAMAMDKGITKDLFRSWGVPTPMGILLRKDGTVFGVNPVDAQKARALSETMELAEGYVPFPCIVKACNGGSSVGVAIANSPAEYEQAKAEAFRYDEQVVVEQFIKGREFSIGVLDGKALPIIEIAPKQGFYDYKNKYQAGSTVETCPAVLPEDKTREMQQYAELAYRAVRYHSYARIDFMMGEDGAVYCLEANTLPGMTPTSLLPQEAAAVGVDFDTLCETILQTAIR